MSAQIIMDGGVPTQGSIEVAAATPIALSNADNAGVLGWKWELFDKPAGSAASLSAEFNSTSGFTPDIPGTYVVRLKTYIDADRTSLDDADEQSAGVRFTGSFLWRLPGAGETNQFDSDKGWKTEVNAIFTAIRTQLLANVALASLSAPMGALAIAGQVEFDQAVAIGPDVAVDIVTTPGQITLQPGVWMLVGAVRPTFGAAANTLTFGWSEITDGDVGVNGFTGGNTSYTTTPPSGLAIAVVSITAAKTYELRAIGISGTVTAVAVDGTFAAVLKLQ